MAFDRYAAARFAVVVGLKAALIGALVVAAFVVLSRLGYLATALVLLGLAALVALSLVRTARAADRLYSDCVTALSVGAFEKPPSAQARHFPALVEALRRASERQTQERQRQAARAHALEALLDTLAAAVIAVREGGELVLANRAARALAGAEAKRLGDIAAIGPAAAARLMRIGVGGREIVPLADGCRMLASVAMFRVAEEAPLRLVSLQSLSSELSAVETRAWHDLVRVLSHEMMNSLTPVVSLSESLARLLAAPEASALEQARTAADLIARRSAGLMGFVERYRRVVELPEPRMSRVALDDLVRDVERLTGEYAAGRRSRYRSHIETPGLEVEGDPELLQQALLNLVKNAVEAVSGVADPEIEIRCRATERHVLIEVRDNGIGLPDSEPEQIFTPFFTTKIDGSGIGLALARQIAIAHGGELTAQRLSPGALFTLGLPRGTTGGSCAESAPA